MTKRPLRIEIGEIQKITVPANTASVVNSATVYSLRNGAADVLNTVLTAGNEVILGPYLNITLWRIESEGVVTIEKIGATDFGIPVSLLDNLITSLKDVTMNDLVANDIQADEVRIDALPDDDHTATGLTTRSINAGATIAIGELCYLGSGGEWLKTDADAEATAVGMLGICLEAADNDDPMLVGLAGSFVRDDSYAWSVGVPLYVGLTLGELTETAPSGSGDIVREVGHAITSCIVCFNPSATCTEIV